MRVETSSRCPTTERQEPAVLNICRGARTPEPLFLYLIKQLTPLSRVVLKNLTVAHLAKKFPAFYGTLRFSTVFTRALNFTLSHVDLVYIPTSCFFKIHLNIILPSTPTSPKWSPTYSFSDKNFVFLTAPMRATCPASRSNVCIVVLWAMTPCSDVVGYQRSKDILPPPSEVLNLIKQNKTTHYCPVFG